jgi:ATP-dependent DNA ligase
MKPPFCPGSLKNHSSSVKPGRIPSRGRDLSMEVCRQDLEGIVAKHHAGRYGEDEPKRWLKIKNPEYSQARDRAELFHPAAHSGRK